MEYLFIYCLQLFDRLTMLLVGLSVTTSLLVFIYIFLNCTYLTDEYAKCLKPIVDFFKKIIIYLIPLTLILLLIPTKNTLLLMGGMYLGKKTVNTIITDEKIKKVDTIINLELDKRIKELKGQQ